MIVAHILNKKGDLVITVMESAPLFAVAKTLADEQIGALVVVSRAGQLVGVVSEREVVGALARFGPGALHLPVRELMASPVTVNPSDPVRYAMQVMTQRRARHLPVVDDAGVVGLLSLGDVVKSRLSKKQDDARDLQDLARWPYAA